MLDAIITAGKPCNLTLQSRLAVILSEEFQDTLWSGRSSHMTQITFGVPHCWKVLHSSYSARTFLGRTLINLPSVLLVSPFFHPTPPHVEHHMR